MPRPHIEPGQWGTITTTKLPDGTARARAYDRDLTGKLSQKEAFRKSMAAAERALVQRLEEFSGAVDTSQLTSRTRLTIAIDQWLADEDKRQKLRPQTLNTYRIAAAKHVVPALGLLTLNECTTARIEQALDAISDNSPGQAPTARIVLNHVLGRAVRFGVLQFNPVRETRVRQKARRPIRALSSEEVSRLRQSVKDWCEASEYFGMRRDYFLLDVIDLALATGARMGEILAIRWDDIDLAASVPTVTISGTVVYGNGNKLIRQPFPKTQKSYRTLSLPRFAVDMLLRRRIDDDASTNLLGLVFHTKTANYISPHNFNRLWRKVRGTAGFDWVTGHTFHKTVATLLESEDGLGTSSLQLGHSSELVTSTYYVQRPDQAPDSTSILDKLMPQN